VPCKEWERLLVERQIHVGGNPALTWCAHNVEIQTDPFGNVRPRKPEHSSSAKVDGIIALALAIGQSQLRSEDDWDGNLFFE
jgi:phage terminase large subunit-like protein